MRTYAFTVLTAATATDDLVDRIYRVCDDATASVEDGTLAVAFDREADSLDRTIRQVLEQLRTLGVDTTSVTIEAESLAVLQ